MVNLLNLLPEYVLHWIVQNGSERHLQLGEVVMKEGEASSSLMLVLDGTFSVFSGPARGEHAEVHGWGSVMGEMGLFTNGIAPVTAVAEEPSLILEIRGSLLAEKLAHDSAYAADFYRAIIQAMAEKLRHTTVRLHSAAQTPEAVTDPRALEAQGSIDSFKALMVQLDKDALKNGGLSDQRYSEFFEHSTRLMHLCHEVLGDRSPLSASVRDRIGARLQHEMLPYVLTTETADRFYSKPRGYAGDYLAIHNIYQNIPGGTGRLGPVVDRMFLDTPPSRAVRNRRGIIAREIAESIRERENGTVRILCMASGPATEVFDVFGQLGDKTRLHATLLDIDLQALAFVDDLRAKHRLQQQITLVNENLIALALGRSKMRVEPQDLVYSIGVLDYLNDKLVGKLLQYAYDNLKPGGRVILGNFHPRNPAQEFMSYVLEWKLIHRTEEDMDRLFRASAFGKPCSRIQFEEEGVNLFAECVKETPV